MRPEYITMITAIVLVGAWIAFVIATNRKAHPKVLFALFLVELWERFSYYGMRAFLILYLTKWIVVGGFNFSEDIAYGIYGAYGAIVYLTPILGGALADRFMGFRKAIIWGAILMSAGQFTLAGSSLVRSAEPTAWKAWQAEKDQINQDTEIVAKAKAEGEAQGKAAEAAAKARAEKSKEEFKALDEQASPNSFVRKMLLFVGLALLTIGNGFFKPNISSMIGKFYEPGDPRRDGAFTIFYMGINIGAFLAPLVCGTFAELIGWHWGFLLAGAGMLVGLGIFQWTVKQGLLEDKSDPPPKPEGGFKLFGLPAEPTIYLGTFLLVPIACMLISNNDVMDWLLGIVGIGMIAYMFMLSNQYDKTPRERIWVIIVLLLFTTVFWTFFELAGSALNVFTDKNVQKNLLGLTLTTSNFQALNALFIMIFAPIFSVMWIMLAKANKEPAAPLKFSAGLLLLGLGFLVLNLGKPLADAGMVPALFLATLYLLHTLGELALSPVGLSLVTKLAPERIVGFMMGFWFLSSSIAHQAGKQIAKLMAVKADTATAVETLDISLKVLTNVGWFAVGSAVILLLLSPILTKWMHGIK